MNIFKNTASQKIRLRAFDATTGLPKTGDAANLTAYVNLDYAGVNALTDTSATEISSTNDPGGYLFDLTQGETNANIAVYSGKSSTANVVLVSETPNMVPAAFGLVAGAAGGLVIAGSNAATTFAGLTTGAISATTITASGAVAFQSTFAVTTSTSLAALSATTITASGAVALQSTLAISGTTTFAAINTGAIGTGTITTTGNVSVSGTVTLTGAVTASNAGNAITGVTAALTGDLTATMKTSVTTAATAATPNLNAAYDAAKTAAQAGDAMALTGGERTTLAGVIWATTIATGVTAIQAMRGFLAAMLGKASGLATTTATYRDVGDSKDVIVATVDADGNRTAVTLDLT